METPIGDDDDSHSRRLHRGHLDARAVGPPRCTRPLREVTKHVLRLAHAGAEAKVLRMRFGIEMNTDHTLEEVGKQVRRHARAGIPQIEAKALRKLRHPSRSERPERASSTRVEGGRGLTKTPRPPGRFLFADRDERTGE